MWTTPHPLLDVVPEPVQDVQATVSVLWPSYEQAWLITSDGSQLAITRLTEGIDLSKLKPGQTVTCVVTLQYPRVLSASIK